jgi:creatinine amidohydrolase
MAEQEVLLAKMTRREFREAMDAGKIKAAVIPVGSNEQHLEHLPMEYDMAAVAHVAVEAARRLNPQVVVTIPMVIGISEHHMGFKGTITAKPGSWLSVMFDAVESLVRHGIKNILILNGHGGNEAPMYGVLRQWQLYFRASDSSVNVHFHSYWNLSREEAEQHCTGRVPGHALDYETSMALSLFPDQVRHDALRDQEDKEPLNGTAEKGRVFTEAAVSKTAEYVQGMIDGKFCHIEPQIFSREMAPKIDW